MSAERVHVMAAIGEDGALRSGSEPAIDPRLEKGKLIAAVNLERDEEKKSLLKFFHIDPSVNK